MCGEGKGVQGIDCSIYSRNGELGKHSEEGLHQLIQKWGCCTMNKHSNLAQRRLCLQMLYKAFMWWLLHTLHSQHKQCYAMLTWLYVGSCIWCICAERCELNGIEAF